jgi:Tat protein secretion system quality control protein TatD with DNase activity
LAPVRAIAELRGTTVEEVAEVTWRNACRLFGGGIVASG